jgi:hypothetical protein
MLILVVFGCGMFCSCGKSDAAEVTSEETEEESYITFEYEGDYNRENGVIVIVDFYEAQKPYTGLGSEFEVLSIITPNADVPSTHLPAGTYTIQNYNYAINKEIDGISDYTFKVDYQSGSITEVRETEPSIKYEQARVHPVSGRQGVCADNDNYWVSGSGTLAKYDRNWNLVAENTDPFEGYELEVNHIGDIDVYDNELYLGVEYFMDGEGKNIQVAVYDADTLKLKRVFPFRQDTGQLECSGIAVDSDSRTVYMTSWIDDESSEYLYMYDLDTGDYKGKLKLDPVPKWLQGVAYYKGSLYLTSDDGDADEKAPDHMYRVDVSEDNETGSVTEEKAFDDVLRQGEIEGLTFDKTNAKLLLLYNRGAKIIAGMPTGFYEGYTEEIHEVFEYDIITGP